MPAADPGSVSTPSRDADRLRQVAQAAGIATLLHLEQTGSTMDAARQLVEADTAPLPALVVADRQSAGRGRRGSGWWLPAGGLAATVVHDVGHLGGRSPSAAWSIACGVAMAEAVAALQPGLTPTVKWPNDVLVGRRKLAGCLVETVPSGRRAGAAVLFGVGVNTGGRAAEAPFELRERIATFPDLVGEPAARGDLLARFLPGLESLCREILARPSALVERYEPLCGLRGQGITLHASTAAGPVAVQGRCLGIDADGALRLLTTRGVERYVSGSLAQAGG